MKHKRTVIDATKTFLSWYVTCIPRFQEAAEQLRSHLELLLTEINQPFHIISTRAKSRESVCAKLLDKQYSQPRRRLTDRIGARVILYHARDVDRVAYHLRRNLIVRERDSIDKRRALGLREFGYRSYHLVCRLPDVQARKPEYRVLGSEWFEIQVRSLLEHVWAEIEHQVVYKSGAEFPDGFKRRFAALAGVLELRRA